MSAGGACSHCSGPPCRSCEVVPPCTAGQGQEPGDLAREIARQRARELSEGVFPAVAASPGPFAALFLDHHGSRRFFAVDPAGEGDQETAVCGHVEEDGSLVIEHVGRQDLWVDRETGRPIEDAIEVRDSLAQRSSPEVRFPGRVPSDESPGRYAVQREMAIGGWLILMDKDSYSTPKAAVIVGKNMTRTHGFATRVVDKSTRRVVWPEEMKGERF